MFTRIQITTLSAKYPKCFSGVGKLKGFQLQLHIDKSVRPVAQPPRRIPFGLRAKVEAELQHLLDDDVIEPAQGPTPWISPVVVTPKPNGEIRLCVDMRRANAAIVRERHPIPTIEEVLQDLSSCQFFSKLDLRKGFHQIELHPDSRQITTFTTHKGLYRYKRLSFGISSAPEVYQHIIQQILQECPGTANIADDILVYGRTKREHDDHLEHVLQTLEQRGLTVNSTKCDFNVDKLHFMGHIISKQGISPDPDKVYAIQHARQPENASETCSFLGLVTFCSKFLPDLATIAEPLRRCSKPGTPFKWGKEQSHAFQTLKTKMTNTGTLAIFDPDAPTRVIADASPVGLGAILLQEQQGTLRVICFASRTLSDVEKRYSQTEKEALALVWACERFSMYLIGRHFHLVTDHKPLDSLQPTQQTPGANRTMGASPPIF